MEARPARVLAIERIVEAGDDNKAVSARGSSITD